jgi:hypothetical protein
LVIQKMAGLTPFLGRSLGMTSSPSLDADAQAGVADKLVIHLCAVLQKTI